jgi:hypothetical protein
MDNSVWVVVLGAGTAGVIGPAVTGARSVCRDTAGSNNSTLVFVVIGRKHFVNLTGPGNNPTPKLRWTHS